MDNIFIGNQSLTDSDYESSEEEPENINYNNIDYDNKYFHNNSIKHYTIIRFFNFFNIY